MVFKRAAMSEEKSISFSAEEVNKCSYMDPISNEIRFVPKKTTGLKLKPGIVSWRVLIERKLHETTGSYFRESKKIAPVTDLRFMRGYIECLEHKIGMPVVYKKADHKFDNSIVFIWTMKCAICCETTANAPSTPALSTPAPSSSSSQTPIYVARESAPELSPPIIEPLGDSATFCGFAPIVLSDSPSVLPELPPEPFDLNSAGEALHNISDSPSVLPELPPEPFDLNSAREALHNINMAMNSLSILRLSDEERLKKLA